MEKRNIERTSNIILKNDVKLTGDNVQMFGKSFDNCQQQLSEISGETLFMENDISLYQMFKQQGLIGRLQGDKSPSPYTSGKGGSEIIGIITNIVDGEDNWKESSVNNNSVSSRQPDWPPSVNNR